MTKKLTTYFQIVFLFSFLSGQSVIAEGIQTSVYVWFADNQVKQVSPNDGGMYYQSCIHPMGRSVLFSGTVSGGPRIWQTDLSSFKTKALTPVNTASLHGVYSWQGDKIAFISDINSGGALPTFVTEKISPQGTPPPNSITNLYVMNSDGSDRLQLTFGDHSDQRPTFSPDGNTVTFVRASLGPGNRIVPTLWSVNTDGSEQVKPIISSPVRWAYRPWYSTDGKRLYFFTIDSKKRHRIASIAVDGGDFEFLKADDDGRSHGPFIDPNGKYLLMHSTRGEGSQHKLWEIPLAGGQVKRLMPPTITAETDIMHVTRSQNNSMAFDTFTE